MNGHLTTTFVTCVEAGLLELQVVLLAKSLRALGTPLGRSDLIAVQPRRDVRLSPRTYRELGDLDVEVVSENLVDRYSWNPHLNKCAAMKWAERNARSHFLTWLDGDLVFLRDPVSLVPDASVGFAARAGEVDQGTDGVDANAPYWQRVSQVLGLDYRNAKLIDSVPPARKIYEYFQAGLYTVAREERISHAHHDFFVRLISAGVASRACGTYHHDQVSLAMAARLSRGERVCYSWEMNYNFNNVALSSIDPAILARSFVLHYHGSFSPANYRSMTRFFCHLPPGVVELIEAHAPFAVTMPLNRRVLRKARAVAREWSSRQHLRSCEVI